MVPITTSDHRMPLRRHPLSQLLRKKRPINHHSINRQQSKQRRPTRKQTTFFIGLGLSLLISISLSILFLWREHLPAYAQTQPHTQTEYLAEGTHGAVASVDQAATQVGIEILKSGGNAVDAAIATAAALGVVEPFSAGIGGGGFMVIYQPEKTDFEQNNTPQNNAAPNNTPQNRTAQNNIITLDGREEAPSAVTPNLFDNPDSLTNEALPFAPNRISSGLAVGVPGTPLNWATAAERYGTRPLSALLQPAIDIATQGFTVDQTFNDQIKRNQARFSAFSSTSELYLPNGQPPEIGSQFTNLDLAKTYQLLAERGVNAFYRGEISQAIAQTVQNPPTIENPPFKALPGKLTTTDLDRYEVRIRPAIESTYRGYRLYGMGLPSSGGITVAQTLNALEPYTLSDLKAPQALQHIIEAERLAFADRNAYIGDPEFVDVPLAGLLNKNYAVQRATDLSNISANNEANSQVNSLATAGNPLPFQQDPSPSRTEANTSPILLQQEGLSTTHLTVVDADGMIVSYTLTIESTGGSGIVVPGYGFILNNELTDFNTQNPHPNVPEPGKRPRSSMSPTIMFAPDGSIAAFGTPGGSTIITTVLNIATNIIDFNMDLGAAIAAPRISQRNQASTLVDQSFETSAVGQALTALGYQLSPITEIGAATGIFIDPDGKITAAAEPTRRGGGSAMSW